VRLGVRLRKGNNAELQLSSYVVAAVQLTGRDSMLARHAVVPLRFIDALGRLGQLMHKHALLIVIETDPDGA
jgi:hypothetical protein